MLSYDYKETNTVYCVPNCRPAPAVRTICYWHIWLESGIIRDMDKLQPKYICIINHISWYNVEYILFVTSVTESFILNLSSGIFLKISNNDQSVSQYDFKRIKMPRLLLINIWFSALQKCVASSQLSCFYYSDFPTFCLMQRSDRF